MNVPEQIFIVSAVQNCWSEDRYCSGESLGENCVRCPSVTGSRHSAICKTNKIAQNRNGRNFFSRKSGCHLKILGARNLPWDEMNTDDTKSLGAHISLYLCIPIAEDYTKNCVIVL